MSKETIALAIDDVSQFARALKTNLEIEVGHQTVLNSVAKAAGYRNFQHLKAKQAHAAPAPDRKQVEKAARWFDDRSRMTGWPAKYSLQSLCLWCVWAQLPPRETMTERQISERIDAVTTFKDAAQIRRAMIDAKLVTRTVDGSAYSRIEKAPPPEAKALIEAVMK